MSSHVKSELSFKEPTPLRPPVLSEKLQASPNEIKPHRGQNPPRLRRANAQSLEMLSGILAAETPPSLG